MERAHQLRVAHVVDAMGGSKYLWGKERVVALLMRAQRAAGLAPALITFSPGLLARSMAGEGFPVHSLSPHATRGLGATIPRLAAALRAAPVDVLHSHGYRANIIARAVRLSGRAHGVRLVSTCHGWEMRTPQLRFYHTVDRWTSVISDAITVPDARMLAALPPLARRAHVPNGVGDLDDEAVEAFARPAGFVVGTLGRVSRAKGVLDVLAAAAGFPDPDVVFVLAGDGELADEVRGAGPNVHAAGYIERPAAYIDALDVYLQASHAEGLSLSLLEAMRAGKAIVATDVGATRDAIVPDETGLLIPAMRPDLLRATVLRLRSDPILAATLGRNARRRFETDFRVQRQHERFLHLYSRTAVS